MGLDIEMGRGGSVLEDGERGYGMWYGLGMWKSKTRAGLGVVSCSGMVFRMLKGKRERSRDGWDR
jgi:hypothetical protein